jgi:hypothetical protein
MSTSPTAQESLNAIAEHQRNLAKLRLPALQAHYERVVELKLGEVADEMNGLLALMPNTAVSQNLISFKNVLGQYAEQVRQAVIEAKTMSADD